MNKRILALAAAAVILAALVQAGPVTLDVKEHVLANGMKILMIPKPGVPRVVCHVYFKVGSINERPGITGSAHVHEHLMFKGTEVMGVTDYAKECRDRRPDRRAHEPGLPGKILEDRRRRGPDRGLAERGRRPGPGPEGLHRQGRPLDAIHEERRHRAQRLDEPGDDGLLRHPAVEQDRAADAHGIRPDDERPLPRVLFREGRHHGGAPAEREPAGLLLRRAGPGRLLHGLAVPLGRHRLDGRPEEDDERATSSTSTTPITFRTTPSPSTSATSTRSDVTAMAEKYFGRIPKGPDLEPIRTGVPAQYSEKRFYGEGPAPTSLQMMFHIPPDGDPDTAALSVLAGTLGSGGGGFRGGMGGGGGTGRLYKTLVRDKQLAVSASASEPAAVVRRRLPVQRDAARRQGRQARGPGEGDLGRRSRRSRRKA